MEHVRPHTWGVVGKQADVISSQISHNAKQIQDGYRQVDNHNSTHKTSVPPPSYTREANGDGPIRSQLEAAEYGEAEPARGRLAPTPPPSTDASDAVGQAPSPYGGQAAPLQTAPYTAANTEHRQSEHIVSPDFQRIRKVCQKGIDEKSNVDLRPIAFASYKREHWPSPVQGALPDNFVKIYNAVKGTGLPNAMGARQHVPTKLDVAAWESCFDEIGGRPHLLDFIKFGFPLGYVGPVSDTQDIDNHPSAADYPSQVGQFIDKEISLGGVIGPASVPPFHPWCHTSPLMSRPKNDGDRRIITDMTFPPQSSVNAYIVKNGLYGIEMEHTLPTIDNLVQCIKHYPPGAFLATLDISRAYKNFNSDPLDWPLLCFKWGASHFCDVTIPFGARASSFHMQSIANALVDILAARNVKAFMYLDDIILVSPDRPKALRDFEVARQLLKDLTLPEAAKKSQPPATSVKWLGIQIDTHLMSLAIPEEKLSEVLTQVSKYTSAHSISKKSLQSILGKLLHVAKCVRPARLFIARLLEALRACRGAFINVNADMRADFRWFQEFCSQWNGVAYIAGPAPVRHIYVDACLSGIGGSDGHRAYAGQVAPIEDGAKNITELEAINVIVALHTFLTKQDEGKHVRVHCDNMAAVQVLQTGKGKNRVLLDCARAAWMVQAVLNVQISYVHVPGVQNDIADALSRSHLSPKHHSNVKNILAANSLCLTEPCLHIFDNIPVPIYSRSGHQIVTKQRRPHTAPGKGARNMGKSAINSANVPGLRQTCAVQPHGPEQIHGLRIHRVPRHPHSITGHHQEQDSTRQDIHTHGGGVPRRRAPQPRDSGIGWTRQEQRLCPQDQGPHKHDRPKVGDICYSRNDCRLGGQGCHTPDVLRSTPTIGGGAPQCQEIRQGPPPDKGRPKSRIKLHDFDGKMGEEYAEGGTVPGGHIGFCGRRKTVPHFGDQQTLRPHPRSLIFRPLVGFPNNLATHSNHYDKGSLGCRPGHNGCGRPKTFPPQPQEGSRYAGTQGGMWRHTDSETGRMEILSFPSIHCQRH